MAASREFLLQLQGYGLTTAEIHYHLPDHPAFLQLYVWQDYDTAPDFPTLHGFLDYWQRELEGALHSVRVAHRRLIRPAEWRAVDGAIVTHRADVAVAPVSSSEIIGVRPARCCAAAGPH